MLKHKSELIDRLVTNDDLLVNSRTFEILEGYEKISDIISRTHAAMGKNQQVKVTTASSGSDKIIAYASPSTH